MAATAQGYGVGDGCAAGRPGRCCSMQAWHRPWQPHAGCNGGWHRPDLHYLQLIRVSLLPLQLGRLRAADRPHVLCQAGHVILHDALQAQLPWGCAAWRRPCGAGCTAGCQRRRGGEGAAGRRISRGGGGTWAARRRCRTGAPGWRCDDTVSPGVVMLGGGVCMLPAGGGVHLLQPAVALQAAVNAACMAVNP